MLTQHQKIIVTENSNGLNNLSSHYYLDTEVTNCRKFLRAKHTSTIARSIGRFYNIYIGIFLIRYIFLDLNITAVVIADIYIMHIFIYICLYIYLYINLHLLLCHCQWLRWKENGIYTWRNPTKNIAVIKDCGNLWKWQSYEKSGSPFPQNSLKSVHFQRIFLPYFW